MWAPALFYLNGGYKMDIWNIYRFRIVYRGNDRKLHHREVKGYMGGTAYGSVKLCVYSDKANHWYCVDPETGMSLSEGRTRQDAVDRARMRLSTVTPEQYGDSVYRAKKLLVEAGVLDYSVERGYTWHVQQI